MAVTYPGVSLGRGLNVLRPADADIRVVPHRKLCAREAPARGLFGAREGEGLTFS